MEFPDGGEEVPVGFPGVEQSSESGGLHDIAREIYHPLTNPLPILVNGPGFLEVYGDRYWLMPTGLGGGPVGVGLW